MRFYAAGKADAIYAALHNFVPGNADDEKAAVIVSDFTAFGGVKLLLIFYFYAASAPPTTGPFAQFLNIDPIIDTTSTQSYAQLVGFPPSDHSTATLHLTSTPAAEIERGRSSASPSPGVIQSKHQRLANIPRSKLTRHQTFTIPYLEDAPQMYSEISDKFTSILANILINPLRLTSQCSVDFQPFPSVIGKHSQERGGNAMGISGSDPDLILLEIQCSWSNPNDDKVFKDASKMLTDWLAVKVPEWTNGEQYYLPYLMNDAAGDQNVTGTYRGYGQFKALQAAMDPAGFFRNRGGGFVY